MCEIGLRGELEVQSITQIQMRERIAVDLGRVYRINSRSAPLSVSILALSQTVSEQFLSTLVLTNFFATVQFSQNVLGLTHR